MAVSCQPLLLVQAASQGPGSPSPQIPESLPLPGHITVSLGLGRERRHHWQEEDRQKAAVVKSQFPIKMMAL